MIICVYAPDSAKDCEDCEKFMREFTKVMLEGRTGGAKRFFVAGDLSSELEF